MVVINMSIGKRIGDLRRKQHFTQDELATRIGISRAALSHYEKDRRDPDYQTLQKIADYFDVSTDYLLGRSNQRNLDRSTKGYQAPLNEKDERDIAKRLDEIKNDIEHTEGLAFDGEPLSDEAKESFLEAMEYVVRQAKRINKKIHT